MSARSLPITRIRDTTNRADPRSRPGSRGGQEVLTLVSRRLARLLTLVCAIAVLAAAPAGALARPATDAYVKPGTAPQPVVVERSPAPAVNDSQAGGDLTLVLILSASALLLVVGGAALAGRRHQVRRLPRSLNLFI